MSRRLGVGGKSVEQNAGPSPTEILHRGAGMRARVWLAGRDVPFCSPDPILLSRYNTDGTLDTSFGDGGTDTLPVDTRGQGNPKAWLTLDGKIDLIDVVQYHPQGDAIEISIRQFNSDG